MCNSQLMFLIINIVSEEELAIELASVKSKHPQVRYESKACKTLASGVAVSVSLSTTTP